MIDIAKIMIAPAMVSLVISSITTFLTIKFAKKLKIFDNPKTRKHPASIHHKPIPRGGGIPIFLSIVTTSLLFLTLDKKLIAILAGGTLIALIGFLDDRKDINPYVRLATQFLAAGFVVASGIGIAFVSNPFGSGIINLSSPKITFEILGAERSIWVLSVVFGLFWIVGLMNAVNWSSGVDGQLSGFTAIAALFIALLSLRFSADITQWSTTTLASIILGAYLGFLPWHIYPQKIMPGFGGSTLAGYMLAIISILATAKVGTLLMVLAVPIADASYTILRRLRAGRSPVWGDRGHLHHKLIDRGWSKQNIALLYWAITGILGIIALYLNAQQKLYTIIGVALLVGGVLVWLNFSTPSQKPLDQDSGLKT